MGNKNMEKDPKPNFEQKELTIERELVIDKLIDNLAKREEMNPDDILSDIVVFAPYEGNDSPNPDYIEQVAEMIGITSEEMTLYAIKRGKDYLGE